MENLIIEPLKYYEEYGQKQHAENTLAYFDELLTRSGIDVEENRATVRALNAEREAINQTDKIIKKQKTFRTLLIIAIVIAVIFGVAGVGNMSEAVAVGVLLLVLGIIILGGAIYLIAAVINPKIKDVNVIRDGHVVQADQLQHQADEQVAPLNVLFEDTDTFRLIEKTIPEFAFDKYFTMPRQEFLVKHHDFVDLLTDESSVVGTLSGSFAGNPFLYCKRMVHEMRTATYTGTLTISWTETYRDSQGKLCTRTRTETLRASVTKPKPEYYTHTSLGYGCQVAPDLSFERDPQHSERLNEKALAKAVKSGEKKLKEKARKETAGGGSFQEMANSEFDVLFGATNRDNEVQFRMMFTPLAQRNMMGLVRNQVGYGDDFRFVKDHRYNIIVSEHAQNWEMNASSSHYYSYDVDEIKLKFVNFNVNYFKSLFFDFAPLFSVPAYVEEPCASLEPMDDYLANYTRYSHELMANAIGYKAFVHPESNTNAILKTQIVQKQGNVDVVSVTANSYATVARVDYVPVRGGDGRYHNVPVEWIEYIPVSKVTDMAVEATELTEKGFIGATYTDESLSGSAYYQGMLARVL